MDLLPNYVSGLSITEISEKISGNRNTVSKYLSILEAKNLVYKKKIGTANLFFSSNPLYLNKRRVQSFLKAILYGLKEIFPNQEEIFKEVGRKAFKKFEIYYGTTYQKEVERLSKVPNDFKPGFILYQEVYNSFDIIHSPVTINLVELQENRAVYKFTNSEFLKKNKDYIYYFYIMCGLTEAILGDGYNKFSRANKRKVICNIEEIKIGKSENDAYFTISIDIK